MRNYLGNGIECRGSYSCSGGTSIQIGGLSIGAAISCLAFKSCANVNQMGITNGGDIVCNGDQSCFNSNLYIDNNDNNTESKMKCNGQLSCANSIIVFT